MAVPGRGAVTLADGASGTVAMVTGAVAPAGGAAGMVAMVASDGKVASGATEGSVRPPP